MYECKTKSKISKDDDEARSDGGKRNATERLTHHNVMTTNGSGEKSFQHKRAAKIEKHKCSSEDSCAQQGETEHSREYKINRLVIAAFNFLRAKFSYLMYVGVGSEVGFINRMIHEHDHDGFTFSGSTR